MATVGSSGANKRQKTAHSSSTDNKNDNSSSSGGGHTKSTEEDDEWSCKAADVIDLRLVGANGAVSFKPTYTHQLFENERIVGYKGLCVQLWKTAGSLFTYLNVSWQVKNPAPDAKCTPIRELLHKRMAPGLTDNLDVFTKHVGEPAPLLGTPVVSYDDCEIRLCQFDKERVKTLHARLQIYLLFFIEASSFIDTADTSWELFLLYDKKPTAGVGPVVAGFCTVYSFFCFPDDRKFRLSQILVLPPYQKRGFGRKLLEAVYTTAAKRKYIQVNIEDPAPAMQHVRDVTDLGLLRKNGIYCSPAHVKAYDTAAAKKVAKDLRITMGQVRRCYEIVKLGFLDRSDEEAYKAYRLEVKARLYKQNEEELSVSATKKERKELLQDMYKTLEEAYLRVLASSARSSTA